MTDSSAFPWLKHLPESAQHGFWAELRKEGVFAHEMGLTIEQSAERMEVVLASWKATAEVHADPELMKALTTPSEGDFGEVEPPETEAQPKGARCGASLPHEDAEMGWYWCRRPAGHPGQHVEDDPVIGWTDGEVIEVYFVEEVHAVPHHQHEFVGDEDKCIRHPGCTLTWGEFKQQQREQDDD